jgi:hypothetical protein
MATASISAAAVNGDGLDGALHRQVVCAFQLQLLPASSPVCAAAVHSDGAVSAAAGYRIRLPLAQTMLTAWKGARRTLSTLFHQGWKTNHHDLLLLLGL